MNVDVINHVMLEYLDYENCKFIKRLIHKLVKKCSQNIYENENIYIVCNYCTIYIVLFVIAFLNNHRH